MRTLGWIIAVLVLVAPTAYADTAFTIDDYNASLVKFGVPFYTRYPASFYTGFAMRVEDAKRLHFRAGRGNQVRLTAILDEHTILTYLYSLQKRSQVYSEAQSKNMFHTESTEHVDAFRRMIDSPTYNILGTIEDFEAQKINKAQLYQTSLDILSALNPHRVFRVSLDLKAAFLNWKTHVQQFMQAYEDDPTDVASITQFLSKNPNDTLVLSNEMLFGRVNAVHVTEEHRKKLAEILALVGPDPSDDTTYLPLALDYFMHITAGKYAVQTVANGQFVPAIQCDQVEAQCLLTYPEFTAIYPNGSVVDATQDRHGNTIHKIRNNALMTFLDRPYHDVDHIRNQGYYGWAPKMDWQGIGNGIHNPGVSHYLAGMSHLYEELDIPQDYKFLWVVSRGPVSHGCIRMSVGHLWEVRHVFPASPTRLKEIFYFGNGSADYDVFDIDSNGTPEVMGSQYYVAYSVKGASGDARRKGKSFSLANTTQADFYAHLYGQKEQFVWEAGTYTFLNPYVSYFRKRDASDKQGTVISRSLQGTFALYEQPYEQDKVQVYRLPATYHKQLTIKNNKQSLGKQMVRIFGRIAACGPFKASWSQCYEDEFDQEFQTLMGQL